MNSYFTIEKSISIELKEKSSKFISFIFPVKNELEVKNNLDELWSLHPKATHICYAYRLGFDKNQYRANDDGEPSGTAGKPILGQIDSHQLSNVLVAIVRYYGGTKLGVSGLIQAYKNGALEAILASTIVEKEIEVCYTLEFDSEYYNQIIHFLKLHKVNIMQQKFENVCLIEIGLPLRLKEDFFKAINEFYQVNLKITAIK